MILTVGRPCMLPGPATHPRVPPRSGRTPRSLRGCTNVTHDELDGYERPPLILEELRVGADRAERHFERADTAEDSAWLSYFDSAELMGELSHCFRDLKMRRESVEQAERAVNDTDPSTPAPSGSAAWSSPKAHY